MCRQFLTLVLGFLLFLSGWPFVNKKLLQMSEGFNTLTINVHGTIKNIEERSKLLACVQLNDINILFLQETHVNDLKFKFQIDKIFNCQSYRSFGTSDSRGVAILLMNCKYICP